MGPSYVKYGGSVVEVVSLCVVNVVEHFCVWENISQDALFVLGGFVEHAGLKPVELKSGGKRANAGAGFDKSSLKRRHVVVRRRVRGRRCLYVVDESTAIFASSCQFGRWRLVDLRLEIAIGGGEQRARAALRRSIVRFFVDVGVVVRCVVLVCRAGKSVGVCDQ